MCVFLAVSGVADSMAVQVLVERQVGRGKRKGRLVQTHKSITDGDLLKNAALKQVSSVFWTIVV